MGESDWRVDFQKALQALVPKDCRIMVIIVRPLPDGECDIDIGSDMSTSAGRKVALWVSEEYRREKGSDVAGADRAN